MTPEQGERLSDKMETIHADIAACRLSILGSLSEMRIGFATVNNNFGTLKKYGCDLSNDSKMDRILLKERVTKLEDRPIPIPIISESSYIRLGRMKLNGTSSILAGCLALFVILTVGIKIGSINWGDKAASNISIGIVPQAQAAVK